MIGMILSAGLIGLVIELAWFSTPLFGRAYRRAVPASVPIVRSRLLLPLRLLIWVLVACVLVRSHGSPVGLKFGTLVLGAIFIELSLAEHLVRFPRLRDGLKLWFFDAACRAAALFVLYRVLSAMLPELPEAGVEANRQLPLEQIEEAFPPAFMLSMLAGLTVWTLWPKPAHNYDAQLAVHYGARIGSRKFLAQSIAAILLTADGLTVVVITLGLLYDGMLLPLVLAAGMFAGASLVRGLLFGEPAVLCGTDALARLLMILLTATLL